MDQGSRYGSGGKHIPVLALTTARIALGIYKTNGNSSITEWLEAKHKFHVDKKFREICDTVSRATTSMYVAEPIQDKISG